MEIRDVIHGSIAIDQAELPVLDSRYIQRLRQIKQLGFSENSYPSATHNRYIHSLGAMHTATRAFSSIFSAKLGPTSKAYRKYRALLRLGALLHDVGHGPLSHTTEFAMPLLRDFDHPLPKTGAGQTKATHEDYTLKILLDSSLTREIDSVGKSHGFTAKHVAALIEPSITIKDDFFTAELAGEKANFRPILSQLISSELDSDRMDYLLRDSFQAGVTYGQFDLDWVIGNLTYHIQNGKCYLALQHRALYTFEDFLISRYHMFLMVYFHHKSVVYDEMLAQYFNSRDCDYAIPSDIHSYIECVDSHLFNHLAKSKNPWARRITNKTPYRMLIEIHSGIPATATATREQTKLLAKVEESLRRKKIHYIKATSTGELSKYFRKPVDPIFVRYDDHYSKPAFIPLEQCTDLFQRYSDKRSIVRLYVSPEDYPLCRHSGRGEGLKFEEPAEPRAFDY